MQTKTVVYLGIILSSLIVGQVVPIGAMFGVPATVLFTAFFVPYFGLKKSIKIILVLSALTLLIDVQTQIGIDVSMISTVKNMGSAGYADIISRMKTNMTETEFQGNLTYFQNSIPYTVGNFVYHSDTVVLAYLFEVISEPVIRVGYLLAAYFLLKRAGFYRQVFAKIKNC